MGKLYTFLKIIPMIIKLPNYYNRYVIHNMYVEATNGLLILLPLLI